MNKGVILSLWVFSAFILLIFFCFLLYLTLCTCNMMETLFFLIQAVAKTLMGKQASFHTMHVNSSAGGSTRFKGRPV
jgi:hypothetical protein